MTLVMVDSAALLLEYLLEEAGSLRTYLGGAYVATPVAPPNWEHEHKAIVFHPETEGSHISGADNETTFTFKCYGGSANYSDARGVYRALHDSLHNARGKVTSAGVLRLAYLVTAFQGPPEPETGWPVHISKFNVSTEGA